MPHIVIEYSSNLQTMDVKALVNDCHHALNGIHNVTLDRIKTRAIPLEHFSVGVHEEKGQMIHVTLKLMTGRSPEARQEMAKILQEAARKYMPEGQYPNSALTVEVVELDRATYIA